MSGRSVFPRNLLMPMPKKRKHKRRATDSRKFDQQRATLMKKATDDAQAERQRLLDEARNAAAALNRKQQETLKNEAQELYQAISRRTQQEVFAIAQKVLTDLAGVSLEERMASIFVCRLQEMNAEAKAGFAEALKTASDPAILRSAFDLHGEQRTLIQKAINETFSAEINIQFETSPDLISGIELTANGQKVAWSIADYLRSLQKGVDDLLKEKDKKAEAEPDSIQDEIKAGPETGGL